MHKYHRLCLVVLFAVPIICGVYWLSFHGMRLRRADIAVDKLEARPPEVRNSKSPGSQDIPEVWFASISGARVITNGVAHHTRYKGEVIPPGDPFEMVTVPVRLRMLDGSPDRHILMFVERGEGGALIYSRVFGFVHTQSENPDGMKATTAHPQGLGPVFVVMASHRFGSLNIRISSIVREATESILLERYGTESSLNWPNLLPITSEIDIPTPFRTGQIHSVSASTSEGGDGTCLDIQIRLGPESAEDRESILCQCRYSLDASKFSTPKLYPPEPPWRPLAESVDVLALHRSVGRKQNCDNSNDKSGDTAVISQGYQYLPSPINDPGSRIPEMDSIWVIKTGAGSNWAESKPVGLIHPSHWFIQPAGSNSASQADIVIHSELQQNFLVLFGIPNCSVRIFRCDCGQAISQTPFALANDAKDWAVQMSAVEKSILHGLGHTERIHKIRAYPLDDSRNARIVVAISARGVDEPVELRFGYSIQDNNWAKVALRQAECEIPCDEKQLNKDSENLDQGEDRPVHELITNSTELLAVPRTLGERNVGSGREIRHLIAVEQTYRVKLKSHDQLEEETSKAVWILNCRPDCNLNDAVPVGLVHPQRIPFHFDQAEIWLDYPMNACFLSLAGVDDSRVTIQLFWGQNLQPLDCQSLELSTNPEEWPPQLELIAQLKTTAPSIKSLDYFSVVSSRGSLIFKLAETNSEGVTYEYSLKDKKWTRIEFEKRDWKTSLPYSTEILRDN